MKKYIVHFSLKGTLSLDAMSESDALKKFWEKENKSIINGLAKNSNLNLEDLSIETKEIVERKMVEAH